MHGAELGGFEQEYNRQEAIEKDRRKQEEDHRKRMEWISAIHARDDMTEQAKEETRSMMADMEAHFKERMRDRAEKIAQGIDPDAFPSDPEEVEKNRLTMESDITDVRRTMLRAKRGRLTGAKALDMFADSYRYLQAARQRGVDWSADDEKLHRKFEQVFTEVIAWLTRNPDLKDELLSSMKSEEATFLKEVLKHSDSSELKDVKSNPQDSLFDINKLLEKSADIDPKNAATILEDYLDWLRIMLEKPTDELIEKQYIRLESKVYEWLARETDRKTQILEHMIPRARRHFEVKIAKLAA